MLKPYPPVVGELETLERVLAGASLARYGDGEFKHCKGQANVSQVPDARLTQRLRQILHDSGDCLVGIPNLHSDTPKHAFWQGQTWAAEFLADRAYVSAFITRPDSAPWINTPDYWAALETLWVGQEVAVVHGSGKSLKPEDLTGAEVVHSVACPRQHAFEEYDAILQRILATKATRVLLCLGPTATVLAVDLCARGVHAVDLGHVALFLRKFRRGESMSLTKDDKSHDKVRV